MADEANPEQTESGRSENGADAREETPARWLLRQVEETFGQITEEEWARMNIPSDAGVQYKHYLYGTPKKPVVNLQSE